MTVTPHAAGARPGSEGRFITPSSSSHLAHLTSNYRLMDTKQMLPSILNVERFESGQLRTSRSGGDT